MLFTRWSLIKFTLTRVHRRYYDTLPTLYQLSASSCDSTNTNGISTERLIMWLYKHYRHINWAPHHVTVQTLPAYQLSASSCNSTNTTGISTKHISATLIQLESKQSIVVRRSSYFCSVLETFFKTGFTLWSKHKYILQLCCFNYCICSCWSCYWY